LANTQLRGEINSRWAYSNVGYGLLGNILTRVAGKDFDALLKQRLTDPLNMKSTMANPTPTLNKNKAMPHTEYLRPTINWQNAVLAGAGGSLSNMNDMLTFAAANVGLVKTDLLPAMELTHIKQGKKDGNDGYITMGWTLLNDNGENLLWKDGGTGGYRTFIGIDKNKKYGVVILTNSSITGVTDIGLHILDHATYQIEPYKYKWALLDTLTTTINSRGIEAGIALYHQLKKENNPTFVFDPHQLNYLGNELRIAKKTAEAIQIYELNASEYPKIPNVYESLGEMYKRTGNVKMAIKNFEFLADKDKQNPRWAYLLDKLKTQN
jgi:serine-type D-Ala-D-Ala carboxypeptidase/endopeptidase